LERKHWTWKGFKRINPPIARLGLGKKEEDDTYSSKAAQKRKEMESEKQETEKIVKKREDKVTKEKQIKEELDEINKVFYCKLCSKQYSKITEYETHLSSYDHNHKKRFQDMKQKEKLMNSAPRAKKEQQRAQKELQQVMLQAAKHQPQAPLTNNNNHHLTPHTPPVPPPPVQSVDLQAVQPVKFSFSLNKKGK